MSHIRGVLAAGVLVTSARKHTASGISWHALRETEVSWKRKNRTQRSRFEFEFRSQNLARNQITLRSRSNHSQFEVSLLQVTCLHF